MMYELNEEIATADPISPPQRHNTRIEAYKLLKPPSEQNLVQESPRDNEEQPPDIVVKSSNYTSRFIYFHIYFIVIASVLGTGILGLPVKLAHSGFAPFIVSYTICYLMQALVLFYVIELLQRATVVLRTTDDLAQVDSHDELDDPALISKSRSKDSGHGPDLHFIGEQFLGSVVTKKIFDIAILLHLVTIMISYGLAGSEAYGHFFGVNYQYLIFPFVILLTCAIIFGAYYLPSVISLLTLGKGSLLFLVVFVTFIVARSVQREITTNWVYIGKSFLVGTVALGGAANVIPVLFNKMEFTKPAMIKMMIAVIAGLSTVYGLNIAWCYYLLRIIPQTGDIINDDYSQFNWVATLVDVFIMVSITVSFCTMGTGLKHVLDGLAKAWRKSSRDSHSNINNPRVSHTGSLVDRINRTIDKLETSGTKTAFNRENPDEHVPQKNTSVRVFVLRAFGLDLISREMFLYVLSYGVVLLIALLNPRGFLAIMENGSSLGLNLSAGVFVATMLIYSRSNKYRRYSIPFPMPKYIYALRYVVLFYFSFAVVYDIALIIFRIIAPAIPKITRHQQLEILDELVKLLQPGPFYYVGHFVGVYNYRKASTPPFSRHFDMACLPNLFCVFSLALHFLALAHISKDNIPISVMSAEVYYHRPTISHSPKKHLQPPQKSPAKLKKSSIERCQEGLFAKIKKLREIRVLHHSLTPDTSANDFEVLEWYGDSVLYERIAFFLFKTRRFMCPDLLSKIRQESINNKNLANCFDILNLRELTNFPPEHTLIGKAKADIVEAIIGELAEASTTRDAQGEIKAVLDELLAYISFSGEKEFFSMNSPALIQHSGLDNLNAKTVPNGAQKPSAPINIRPTKDNAPTTPTKSSPPIKDSTSLPTSQPVNIPLKSAPNVQTTPATKFDFKSTSGFEVCSSPAPASTSTPAAKSTPASVPNRKATPTKYAGKFDRSFYQPTVQYVKSQQEINASAPKADTNSKNVPQINQPTKNLQATNLALPTSQTATSPSQTTSSPKTAATASHLQKASPHLASPLKPLQTATLYNFASMCTDPTVLAPPLLCSSPSSNIFVGNRSVAQFSVL